MGEISLAPNLPKTHRALPIFGLGTVQRAPFLSTSDRLNCVVELTDNGRQAAALLGLPGLISVLNFGAQPARAFFVKEGTQTFYVAVGNQIVLASPNVPLVTIATLTTDSGPVWMDDNGTQLFINDGVTALVYTYATGAATPVTNINFPAGARGGVFLQGRFWVYTTATAGANAGRVYASNPYDGLTWDGLNFFTPAARPTGIVAVIRWFNDLVVIGQRSVEWWTGTPTVITGALGFQPSANANTEVGGSAEQGVASVNQRLFFVGHGEGPVGVYEIQGYNVQRVSTPAIDDALSALNGSATAICCGYLASGHGLFQVTVPGQTSASAGTFVFDTLTNLWSRRSSYNQPYYRGLLAAHTNTTAYTTDAFTGTLYALSPTAYDEAGQPMECEVTSTHLLKEGDMLVINKIQIDMETGVGKAGTTPRGIIQVSKDGGHTWGMERFVDLGKVGEYTRRAQLYRLGAARDIAIRFRITESMPRRITGAYLILEAGTA